MMLLKMSFLFKGMIFRWIMLNFGEKRVASQTKTTNKYIYIECVPQGPGSLQMKV